MSLPEYRNNNPFVSVYTAVYQTGETYVTWELDPDFDDPGPYAFYLEVANTDTPQNDADYEVINPTDPVIDQSGYIVDNVVRRHSFDNKAIYRITLETLLDVYHSDPEKPNGNLPKHLLSVYREVIRKERLRLSPKMGGTSGILFKRRTYGPRPTEDSVGYVDKNTGQVINYNTTECFGTEFLGGYFAGIDYPLLYLSEENLTSEITKIGTREEHTIKARGLVYPLASSKDVWYEADTGRAFYIDSVQVTSKFSAKPLSLTIEMKMASPLDIIYDFIDFQFEGTSQGAEPFAIGGYYPLYYTEDSADKASPEGKSHEQKILNKIYYMPEGLQLGQSKFEGDYSFNRLIDGGGIPGTESGKCLDNCKCCWVKLAQAENSSDDLPHYIDYPDYINPDCDPPLDLCVKCRWYQTQAEKDSCDCASLTGPISTWPEGPDYVPPDPNNPHFPGPGATPWKLGECRDCKNWEDHHQYPDHESYARCQCMKYLTSAIMSKRPSKDQIACCFASLKSAKRLLDACGPKFLLSDEYAECRNEEEGCWCKHMKCQSDCWGKHENLLTATGGETTMTDCLQTVLRVCTHEWPDVVDETVLEGYLDICDHQFDLYNRCVNKCDNKLESCLPDCGPLKPKGTFGQGR